MTWKPRPDSNLTPIDSNPIQVSCTPGLVMLQAAPALSAIPPRGAAAVVVRIRDRLARVSQYGGKHLPIGSLGIP